MRLTSLDLNLLVVLDAVLEEQSVLRAARRLHLSPSATSHALARLRDTFNDSLLVKSGRRLLRTPRGDALLPRVKRAIAEVEDVFRARPFEAKSLDRTFRIMTTDHVELVLFPALDAILEEEAPNVDVICMAPGDPQLPRLRTGEVDCAIRLGKAPGDEFAQLDLFRDELVAVVRKGHPAGYGPFSLKDFAAMKHVLVSPSGRPRGVVDVLLEPHGLTRRAARVVPTFCEAAHWVSASNAVATLPRRLVEVLAPKLRLARARVPLALPTFDITLFWHQRTESDPEHCWLRSALARAAASSR